MALMTGSEGLLGVVTEITVKLLPRPERAQVVLAAFDDVGAAGQAVANVIAAGIIPAGMEMMDQPATLAPSRTLRQCRLPDRCRRHPALRIRRHARGSRRRDRRIEKIMQDSGAHRHARVARRGRAPALLGRPQGRLPGRGPLSPDYYCMDGTIPRRRLAEVLRGIAAMEKKYGLRCANVFHAGDGNLHPLILYDANDPASCSAPSCSAPRSSSCASRSAAPSPASTAWASRKSLDVRAVRRRRAGNLPRGEGAFDEHGLLNPGKAVPTLHRCAEFGACMCIRANQPQRTRRTQRRRSSSTVGTLWRLSLKSTDAAAQPARAAARRVEWRAALAEIRRGLAGGARCSRIRRWSCDPVPRSRQAGRRLPSALPGACAHPPAVEEHVRPCGHSQSGTPVRLELSRGQQLSRTAGERVVRNTGATSCAATCRSGSAPAADTRPSST
jgi:hypothetical protein